MKILQISSAQTIGGGERHLADLANALVDRGHEVFAALRPHAELHEQLARIPKENISVLPLRNSLDVSSARGLAKLVRQNNIQIIHAHMARDYPLAAYAARQNPDARLILTRHVLFALNKLHRITFRNAARVIAVSQAVAAQLRADNVLPDEKISVVLNGIDIERFVRAAREFDRNAFRQSLKLPASCLLVGTVGELTPLKGHEDFLRGAASISERNNSAYFLIAGIDHSADGRNESQIEALIDELNLRPRVRRVKWLDNLPELHLALDVFVSASHTESFGLAIVEAMASNTAVIATETAGAQEIIRNGETGLLTPIGDVEKLGMVIEGLLNDQEQRSRIAAAAQRDAVERFSLKRMVDETEAIYRASLQ